MEELSSGFLTPAELGALLRVSISTLAVWRKANRGPKWLRLHRAIRYPRKSVTSWLGARVAGNSGSCVALRNRSRTA